MTIIFDIYDRTIGKIFTRYKKLQGELIFTPRDLTNRETADINKSNFTIDKNILIAEFQYQTSVDHSSREWYETGEAFMALLTYLFERFKKNAISLATIFNVLEEYTGLTLNRTLLLHRKLISEPIRNGHSHDGEIFMMTDLLWYFQIQIGHSNNYDYYVYEHKMKQNSDILLKVRIKKEFVGPKNIGVRKCFKKLIKTASKKVVIEK